jgi:hypothetical protein
LLCGKAHLLLIGHCEQQKLLLQHTKLVLRVQRLRSWRECGRVGLQEDLIRTGPLKTTGTTPIPAVAIGTPTSEATDSLRHQL